MLQPSRCKRHARAFVPANRPAIIEAVRAAAQRMRRTVSEAVYRHATKPETLDPNPRGSSCTLSQVFATVCGLLRSSARS